jgi:hypothetical protein
MGKFCILPNTLAKIQNQAIRAAWQLAPILFAK